MWGQAAVSKAAQMSVVPLHERTTYVAVVPLRVRSGRGAQRVEMIRVLAPAIARSLPLRLAHAGVGREHVILLTARADNLRIS